MSDVRRVIEVAEAEIGYLEKASAKDLDDPKANPGDGNYTKYARDMDAIKGWYNGRKQGAGWCDVWVDWCFVQAYGALVGRELLCQPMGSCGAGPYYSAQYFRAKHQFFAKYPEKGDQIFFHPADGDKAQISHTGLVVAVDGDTITTIEGNVTSSDKSGVWQKTYKVGNARIAGYGRPDWTRFPEEEPEQPTEDDGPFNEDEDDEDLIALRAGNSIESQVVKRISPEEGVEVVCMSDKWFGVWTDGRILWITADDLKNTEWTVRIR